MTKMRRVEQKSNDILFFEMIREEKLIMIFYHTCFQLDLFSTDDGEGDMTNYQENGEFKLESFRAKKSYVYYSCCPNPFPDITFFIELRRRPMFYVFNLILPCLLINGIGKLDIPS